MRTWKPGDVAVITQYGREDLAVFVRKCGEPEHDLRREDNSHWHYLTASDDRTTWTSKANAKARPVLILDPDSPTDCARLAAALATDVFLSSPGDRLHAALKSMLEPPKPEEPTGRAATVEASCTCCPERRRIFVRDTDEEFPNLPWHTRCGSHEWAGLTAVKVLNDGVTP